MWTDKKIFAVFLILGIIQTVIYSAFYIFFKTGLTELKPFLQMDIATHFLFGMVATMIVIRGSKKIKFVPPLTILAFSALLILVGWEIFEWWGDIIIPQPFISYWIIPEGSWNTILDASKDLAMGLLGIYVYLYFKFDHTRSPEKIPISSPI